VLFFPDPLSFFCGFFMWADDPWRNVTYCWVVFCKNAKAHRHTNVLFGHKIPLAETEAFESLPVSGPFDVKCDECGHESSYNTPEEVARVEFQFPRSFTPHSRFVQTTLESEMPRDWREIAAEMSKAKDDPERISQLVRELEEALKVDQQGRRTLRIDGRTVVEGEKPPEQ
jgi:hypothetical protein